MKSKKKGLLLIGFGVICIAISLYMLRDRQETEGKSKIEPDTITEDGVEEAMQDIEGQDTSVTTVTTIELERDKPVQEINSDMYEWPHDNVWFEGYKEPDIVVYLAQRKEMFDEIVEGLNKYEGKELSAWIVWQEEEQVVGFSRTFAEDMEDDARYNLFEKFFREGMILSIYVEGDNIAFEVAQNSHEFLYYYYDENRNEETDEFLEDTSIVHVAPHWWWQEPSDPG